MALTPEEAARRNSRLKAGAAAVVLLGAAAVLSTIYMSRKTPEVVTMPKSEDVYVGQPAAASRTPPKEGDVTLDTTTIVADSIIATKERYNGQFMITAQDMPATIRTVSMPYARDYGVMIDAAQCTGTRLTAGLSCVVTITYDPSAPNRVDSRLLITAVSDRSDGSSREITKSVTLRLSSVAPQVVRTDTGPQNLAQAAPVDEGINDHLRRRQRTGLLQQQQSDAALTHMGPQKPRHDSWSSIGFKPNMSTFPVDLSRTVTMDKPIPAVIKIPIDSRSAGRAVATVERDIYGGDGRLVVIERGSTLIGTVGSVGTTGEEKVAIAWQRIVRPDGAAFAITASSGDAMGRPAVPAYIDNRWFDRFGRTLLFSVLQGGISASVGGQTTTNQSTSGTQQTQDSKSLGVQIANQTVTPLIQEYMREQLALPPIRTVPVGTRITVFPTTDLVLRPINPTDEMREEYAAKARNSVDYQTAIQAQRAYANPNQLGQQVPQGAQLHPVARDPQTGLPIAPTGTGPVIQPGTQGTIPAQLPGNAFGPTLQPSASADASAAFISAPTATQTLQDRYKNTARPDQQQGFSPIQPPQSVSPFAKQYGVGP